MTLTATFRDPSSNAATSSALRVAMEEQIIIDYLPLADGMARKFSRKGPDVEDLVQVARLALVKAAQRFDPQLNTNFIAFAQPTISGELKRYLRDHTWMVQPPRGIQDLQVRIQREQPALCQLLGREPTLPELAAHLGQTQQAVAEALSAQQVRQPDSLDVPESGRTLEERLPGNGGDVFAAVDDSLALSQALKVLTAWERMLLRLRFFEEQSQQSIGQRMRMSQVQVSRALSRILVKLQQQMLQHSPATASRHPVDAGNQDVRAA